MKLIDDWRTVLRKAWSIRLVLLVALLGALELVLPMFADLIPRAWYAVATVVLALVAAVARVVAQPRSMPK